MIKIRLITAALLLSFWVAAASQAIAAGAQVNVYSARKEVLIKPLFDAFTAETGIVVNLISAKADALLQRLEREGANSPADVFLTTDAGRLAKAKQLDLLQPVSSELLDAALPAQHRHPAGAGAHAVFGVILGTGVGAGIVIGGLMNHIRWYVSAFSVDDPGQHVLSPIPAGQWPEIPDVLIGVGGISGCVLLFMLVNKIIPVVSIWEVTEGLRLVKVRRFLGRYVVVIAKSH